MKDRSSRASDQTRTDGAKGPEEQSPGGRLEAGQEREQVPSLGGKRGHYEGTHPGDRSQGRRAERAGPVGGGAVGTPG